MVKSADRVIQVLEYIVLQNEGVSHKDIAQALDIPKSSLSALLSNLVGREYLTFEEITKRYRIGPKILFLAGRFLSSLDIYQLGKPVVQKVMLDTDESTELAIRIGNKIRIICKEDSSRSLQGVIKLGDSAPIYATAAGKAILANLSDEEIESYLSSVTLKQITKQTITNKKKLLRQLEEIRSSGIAYSHEELNLGLIAMAVPVFDLNSAVAASIVVPVPTPRFTEKKKKNIEQALRKASEDLSHQLGYDRS